MATLPRAEPIKPTDQRQFTISPREREIARLIAEGYGNKEIAVKLGLSEHTVSTYVQRVFQKLSVHSRAAMIATLLSRGILIIALLLWQEIQLP